MPSPDDERAIEVPSDDRRSCAHSDFVAHVDVGRIAPSDDAMERDEIDHFVADVKVKCAVCGAAFGFRAPDVGVLPDRPTVSVNALELRVPLISPSELELLGPLAAMQTGKGTGVTFRVRDER